MGLDLGTKTIGLAISDPGRRVASPLVTIERTKFARRRESPARPRRQERSRRLRSRPPPQHGRLRGPACPVDPRLCAEPRRADRACRSSSGTSGCRPPPSPARSLKPTPAASAAARSSTRWPPPTSSKALSTASPGCLSRGPRFQHAARDPRAYPQTSSPWRKPGSTALPCRLDMTPGQLLGCAVDTGWSFPRPDRGPV